MDENDTIIIVGAIVGVLALVAVILRFYVRYHRRSGFSWDDWFILISILSVIAIDAVDLYAASSNGKIEYTQVDVLFTKITFTGTVLYFTLTSTTKLSILFLYNRLFSVNTSFRLQVIALIIVVTGFWIGTVVADLLNSTGIVEAVIDIAILSLPIPVVSRLRLKGSKRYGIIGVFLVGFFVVISGIVKVILSYVPNSREPSFNQTQIWTTVHSCTGIICACMPVCWPLFTSLGKLSPSTWPMKIFQRKKLRSSSSWPSPRYLEHNSLNRVTEGFDLSTSETRQILQAAGV
ncbi:hypothetical protein GGR55DRAFT_224927 [Xylaria sp. FL0064]|nr:hypothetical protein GGR55DRAFT_224927 [Xylaria sp. FL0064]